MLLRWLLNLLAAVILWRVLRRAFGPRSAPRAGAGPSPRLDPDREVRASWTEVRNPGEGGRS
ncbi:MAG: hypothetical protein ACT4PE_08930 [Candidatus Eiseniibacteriota bacterium]